MSKNLERAPFASVQQEKEDEDEVMVSEWRQQRLSTLLLSRVLLLVQACLATYMLAAESSASVETRRVMLVLVIVLAFAVGMLSGGSSSSSSSWSLSVRRDDAIARIDADIASLRAEEAKLVADLESSSFTGAARESARQRVSVVVARRLKIESLRRKIEDSHISAGEKVLACQQAVESSPAAFPHAMQVAAPVAGFDGIDGATGMPRVAPASGPQSSAVYDFPRQ